jgi:hypothetical protein
MSLDLDSYVKQESKSVLDGERLLPPEALMERWGINYKELKKYSRGEHPGGITLRTVWIGPRTARYRLVDVLEFEYECAQFDNSR